MRSTLLVLVVQCSVVAGLLVHAWVPPLTLRRASSTPCYAVSRRDLLEHAWVAPVVAVVASTTAWAPSARAAPSTTLPNGVSYIVIKSAPKQKSDDDATLQPVIGELVAIRFSATANGIKIDDIYDNPEPYYTRLGSGGLIPGVEQTLPLMKLGDRWELTIPGNLAFGNKGRPASAGKPRIPADATVIFDVEMVGIPGKEPELIELIGDF